MDLKKGLIYLVIGWHLLLWILMLSQGGTGIDGNIVFLILLLLGSYLLAIAGTIQGFQKENWKQFFLCGAITLVPFFV